MSEAIAQQTDNELVTEAYVEAGRESEPLALEEIVADVLENLDRDQPILLGPGSTVYAIKHALGFEGTLRGFDILDGGALARDVTADAIAGVADRAQLVISFTRQQGFLLGRGNQQLTPGILRALAWPQRVTIVATRTKLCRDVGNRLYHLSLKIGSRPIHACLSSR